jgi:hypothetical protein
MYNTYVQMLGQSEASDATTRAGRGLGSDAGLRRGGENLVLFTQGDSGEVEWEAGFATKNQHKTRKHIRYTHKFGGSETGGSTTRAGRGVRNDAGFERGSKGRPRVGMTDTRRPGRGWSVRVRCGPVDLTGSVGDFG